MTDHTARAILAINHRRVDYSKETMAGSDAGLKCPCLIQPFLWGSCRPVEPYEQRMPKARILSHQIDKDSIETLDQKDGLFNPVKVEDVRTFDSVSQDAMEERAIENGILDKAFENAENIIRKIIDNDLVEELGYTVCFETIE